MFYSVFYIVFYRSSFFRVATRYTECNRTYNCGTNKNSFNNLVVLNLIPHAGEETFFLRFIFFFSGRSFIFRGIWSINIYRALIGAGIALVMLIISKIFFTGTTTPEDKQYSGGDAYIIITNNSDVTLFADSIAVLESQFMTIDKQDYTPNVMNEAFSVEAVYMIPGKGRSVAVEPGKSLTLAINAIDHREANPNSFDLSGADFEFYDESSNPKFTDPDGPATNLDKWYCYTATVYGFHNRGFRSMAIARMQTSKENWLENYAYTAAYTWTFNEYSFDRTVDTYKVPNAWILDAVNLSVESEFQWIVTSPALDAGWTYCGKVDKDQTRYNKAVVRKKDADGKYIDTNNSTNDFEPEAKPSYLN